MPNEPAQSLRIRRLGLSVFMYVMATVPLGIGAYFELTSPRLLVFLILFGTTANLAFYLLIRTGINLRFADPSLSLPQMLFAIPLDLYGLAHAGPMRGAYLLILLVIFVFGCYRLSTRTLLALSIPTVVVYGALLPWIRRYDGYAFYLPLELALWLTTAGLLPAVSLLAGSISSLRKRLAQNTLQLEALLAKVTAQATRDELTGAYNRRHILELLAREKALADRDDSRFCIGIVDLDHFKRVNDTWGHHGGDVVLTTFAEAAQASLRAGDVFARYGGEEFLLLLPDAAPEAAGAMLGRLRERLADTAFESLPNGFRITLSAGVAAYRHGESIEQLISRADEALYLAKQQGRNRVNIAAGSGQLEADDAHQNQ